MVKIDLKRIQDATEYLLRSIKGDQSEALICANETRLARFTPQCTHQFVDIADISAGARSITAKKIGCSSTSSILRSDLRRTGTASTNFSLISPPNNDFISLPKSKAPVRIIDRRTDPADHEKMNELIKAVVDEGKKYGVDINGSLSAAIKCISVRNSLGVDSLNSFSEVSLRLIAQHGNEYGYASVFTDDIDAIEHELIAETAVKKSLVKRMRTFKKGSYRVVLEPDAVADMIVTMAIFAFSGKSYYEKRSYVNSRLGKKIISKNLSLTENAKKASAFGSKIDYEGVKKVKVDLIVDGKANALVHDSFSAGLLNTRSTGNAMPAPNPFGPIPTDLSLDFTPFKKTITLEDVIYITRFHYTNIEDEKNLIYTGMTRDGTFYYDQKGKIYRLPNLRFRVSIPEVLSQVLSASGPASVKEGFFESGYCKAPTLQIEGFDFQGTS